MKTIMILGAGEMQVPVVQKAKELGHKVIVIDFNPNAPGFYYGDKVYVVSTIDAQKVLEIAIIENIDGVLTTSDYPVRNSCLYLFEAIFKGH